jgi:hypothetical protein
MKNLFKICLLLSVIIPQISHSSNVTPPENDAEKRIELKGYLEGSSTTKSVFQTPVEATISSNSLNVDFLSTLGDINVEVISVSEGLVYTNTVNAQTQQSLSINVSGWDYGMYEIRFTDSNGNYLYGTFEIGL